MFFFLLLADLITVQHFSVLLIAAALDPVFSSSQSGANTARKLPVITDKCCCGCNEV